jgi:phosphatidate cytidylyltransferase
LIFGSAVGADFQHEGENGGFGSLRQEVFLAWLKICVCVLACGGISRSSGETMKSRLISFVTIWLVVGLIVFFAVRGYTEALVAGVAILVALTAAAHREFCVILEKCGGRPNTPLSVILGVIVIATLVWGTLDLSAPVQSRTGDLGAAVPGLIAGTATLVLLFLSPAKLTSTFSRASTCFSWALVPCSILPLALLACESWATAHDASGLLLVIWIIATVKFTDCGGLVIGCTLGRHKLAPTISPKKTWEGCAGGVAASVLIAVGLAWLFGHFSDALHWKYSALTPAKAALLALPLSVLSIPSDLIESVFKRKADVKDSGTTFPGIGGAFDLLDSLLLPAPVAYSLLKLFVLR